MVELAAGTKENLVVDVDDRLDNLTTLDGLVIKFDVKDHAGVSKITQSTATSVGMLVKCLVDTTGWAVDNYDLWIDITVGAEKPRLGPHHFAVR